MAAKNQQRQSVIEELGMTFKHYCMIMRSLSIDQFYLTQEMRMDQLSLCMFITFSCPFMF